MQSSLDTQSPPNDADRADAKRTTLALCLAVSIAGLVWGLVVIFHVQ